jgi:hypothetical protein
MCGSGTLLLEAALMARNIAPGLSRDPKSWPFVRWPDFQPKVSMRMSAGLCFLGSKFAKGRAKGKGFDWCEHLDVCQAREPRQAAFAIT